MMFEQLEEKEFNRMYASRKNGGVHESINLAYLPITFRSIEKKTSLSFEIVDEVHQAVVGYGGRECFVLSTDVNGSLENGIIVQCSSLLNAKKQRGILSYVIKELDLGIKDCVWLRKGMLID